MTINKIKINTAAAVIDNRNLQKKIFLAVAATFLLFLSLYIFFVGRTVFNIIQRKTAESSMRTLSSNTNNLEVEYMALTKNIDLSLANSMGFNEPKNIYFASRRASVGSLTMASDEL